jgi:8-oxo-dGTP pyrophosphatase MutT (NUDIX family)
MGHWDFPKGGPLPNEEPKATVIREVFEETGHHISIILYLVGKKSR